MVILLYRCLWRCYRAAEAVQRTKACRFRDWGASFARIDEELDGGAGAKSRERNRNQVSHRHPLDPAVDLVGAPRKQLDHRDEVTTIRRGTDDLSLAPDNRPGIKRDALLVCRDDNNCSLRGSGRDRGGERGSRPGGFEGDLDATTDQVFDRRDCIARAGIENRLGAEARDRPATCFRRLHDDDWSGAQRVQGEKYADPYRSCAKDRHGPAERGPVHRVMGNSQRFDQRSVATADAFGEAEDVLSSRDAELGESTLGTREAMDAHAAAQVVVTG